MLAVKNILEKESMKNLGFVTMLIGLTIFAANNVSAQQCVPNDNQIAVFQNGNFGGTCKVLNEGNYLNPQAMGFKNDDMSSVKVGKNITARLCQNDYFEGCKDIDKDAPSLGNTQVGDNQVSSIVVIVKSLVFPAAAFPLLERVEVQDYALRWNDSGSGNKNDIAIWHPKAPAGYFVFGSIGFRSNSANPKGQVKTYAYKPIAKATLINNRQVPTIVNPINYRQIWTDRGSGAKQSVSIWSPICPAGYVSLGYVANTEFAMPSKQDCGCLIDSAQLLEPKTSSAKYQWKEIKLGTILFTTQRSWSTDTLAPPLIFPVDPNDTRSAFGATAGGAAGVDIRASVVRPTN